MAIQIQAIKKCGFLRQIAEGAKKSTSTLKETLLAAQSGHFVSTFSRGRLVVSQSGSGQSGSFEIGVQGKEWTQDNVFGLVEELIQMVESCDPASLPDDGTPVATELLRSAIAENVMAGNVPSGMRATGGDFTLLNVPVFGGGMGV